MADSNNELVFVYGTLRRGGSNAFRMDGAEFVGRGEVTGRLVAVSWYPGLVPGALGEWVTGDVFEVSPEHLRKLDEYEGLAAGEVEGSEYRRVRVKVYIAGQQGLLGEAWVWQWIGPVDEAKMIRSGDWMDVEHPRPAPWLTLVALGCLLALPAGLAARVITKFSAMPWLSSAIIVGALISPFIALVATNFGNLRRERWGKLRSLVEQCATGICWLVALGIFLWLTGLADP